MTEAELKKHLDAAEKSPKEIAAAVSGYRRLFCAADRIRRSGASSRFSRILPTSKSLYGYRLRQMLADEKPVIAPMDQDAWAKNLGYLDASAPELVALYGLNRHHNLRLLRRLKAEDLEKVAFHPEYQKDVTVARLVEQMAGHGANHLAQIEKLKREAK